MSIATEISRLTTLRNSIRAKLIALGIISDSSADLEDCYNGINGITAKSGTDVSLSSMNAIVPAGYYSSTATVNGPFRIVKQPTFLRVNSLRNTYMLDIIIAGGTGNYTYEWQHKTDNGSWTTISNANKYYVSTDVISKALIHRVYHCIVTDGVTTLTSLEAGLDSYGDGPVIIDQPKDAICNVGDTVTFHCKVSDGAYVFQWQYTTNGVIWVDLSSSGNATDTVTITTSDNDMIKRRLYRCRISNRDDYRNAVYTNLVKIYAIDQDICIIKEPEEHPQVLVGQTLVLSVSVQGTPDSYIWQYSTGLGQWSDCDSADPGYNTSTISVNIDQYRARAMIFRCKITKGDRVIYTRPSIPKPIATSLITVQPTDTAITAVGETVSFSVTAVGTGTLTYKWQYRVRDVSLGWGDSGMTGNATNTVTFEASSSRVTYEYRCIVMDSARSYAVDISDPVHVEVKPLPVIFQQPSDISVAIGEPMRATVAAYGDGLFYKWYYINASQNSVYIAAGPDVILSFATSNWNGRSVYCAITDVYGRTVNSDMMTVTVTS